ncbi:MAG: four helix bundle protein [Ignavibacteria bacterium GWB2_35_6b]|nr:MAG: four helix bundle protein [Ignavibacteria bacterium GWB2_35_6b]
MKTNYFAHEKLNVYQKSLEFVQFVNKVIKDKKQSISVVDQLDRASTSIPLNIAEGNGKYTSKDKCRFFDNAKGSVLESSACLDIMLTKEIITFEETDYGKNLLSEIFSMLIGLIKSNSDRVYEEQEEYIVNGNLSLSDKDQDKD